LEGTRNIPEGRELVLVEDVFTTGGSALRTLQAIRDEGFEVAAVIALVDREEGGLERVRDESGVPRVEALYSRRDFPGEHD
jgi:orotate phosphoribosyltransferase